jgi:zinc protease
MSRSVWAAIAALLLLSAGCATGAGGGLPDDPVLKPYEPKRWVGTPKSGLRVIVQEDHSSPLVSIVTSVGVGATADPKGVEGLAHFVEHLVFRSKPFGGDTQYWDLLKRTGGFFNASTSWDFTTYYTTAHKDQLETLMRLEAWRIMNTVGGVTSQVFDTEREVVRNELRQRWETTPGNKMFDLLFDSLYPVGHPLRRPIGGTHESLTAAKLEHAQAFVKEYYKPDNTTITIVGDVTTQQVKDLLGTWPAELLFGPGGQQGPAVEPRKRVGERPAPPVPPPVTTKLTRHKGPIDRPVLLLAWSLPPGLRGNDAIASFAASRLNMALGNLDVREEDDIMNAGAGSMPLADSSIMFMQAELRPWADPERARKRLLDILVHSWADQAIDLAPETAVRVDKMSTEANRWFSAIGLLLRAAEPLSTAAEVSEYMAATGKPSYFSEQLTELKAINSGGVSDFAYKWLTRERAVAVYFEPESDKIPVVAAGGGRSGGPAGGESARHDIGRGMNMNASEFSDEKLRQMVKSPGLAQVPRFTASNGLEIYVIEKAESPVVRVELGLRGGNASMKPVGAAGLSDSLARPTCPQYKALDSVGGFVFGGVGSTTSFMSAEVLAGNLNNALAAMRDRVSCREVRDEAFLHIERLLGQEAKVFDRQAVYPDFIAQKWFSAQLYPDHPFGQAGFVSPAELKGLTREDAQSFVSSLYKPGNAVAVVHGGVTLAEVRAGADQFLGSWRGGTGGGALSVMPAPDGPKERQIHLVNRDKATQAVVNIGCRLTSYTPETLPAYDILEAIANESAWAIREQYGATYGVHAGVRRNADRSASLQLGGAIENKQAGASIGRLLRVVESLGNGSIAEPLFLTARWDVGRGFVNSMATSDARANVIINAKLLNLPFETYDNYPDYLAKTRRESLKTIMAPCLGKEVIAIVGDAAVLKPQLEAAGLKVSN